MLGAYLGAAVITAGGWLIWLCAVTFARVTMMATPNGASVAGRSDLSGILERGGSRRSRSRSRSRS